MNQRRILLAMLALLGAAGSARADSATIVLHPEASVTGSYVRLGEVAEVQGENARALSTIFLGPAPEVQQQKKINRAEILRCLKARGYGEDVLFSGSEEVQVRSAPEAAQVPAPQAAVAAPVQPRELDFPRMEDIPAPVVQITPAATTAPTATPTSAVPTPANARGGNRNPELADKQRWMINQAITAYVTRSLNLDKVADADFATDVLRCTGFTPETREVIVDALRAGEIPGRGSVTLLFKDEHGKPIANGAADLNVTLTVMAPILNRNLKINEEVRGGDVTMRRVRFKPGMPVSAAQADDFDNLAAGQAMRAGMVVQPADFRPRLDVRKGQSITIISDDYGFKISEQAIAGADARRGETIPVESVVTKNNYRVRVTGPGTAMPPTRASNSEGLTVTANAQ